MESGLYEGVVRHERLTPTRHRFEYRLFMAYVDLAELPELVAAGAISERRWGLAAFRRGDHLGPPERPLERTIRELVRGETGAEPAGPIRALTQLSFLGLSFSPLNLFYCFERDGRTVEAVVAEVRNTPWLERHAYVLWSGNRDGVSGHRHAKAFHVSPFMDMAIDYRWRLNRPGATLSVDIENVAEGATLFRAGLDLRRREFTRMNANRLLLSHPLQPAQVTAAIYYQAFQLWRKKCPYYPHPKPPATPPGARRTPAAPLTAAPSTAPVFGNDCAEAPSLGG